MSQTFTRAALAFLLAGIAAGCTNRGADTKPPSVKAEAARAKAPNLGKQRRMLSEGYSMLYKDAGNLDSSELILYVKVESDAMDKVVTAVADYGKQLEKDLGA